MEKPIIKSVTVKKDDRTHLWHLVTNGNLLAVILNKKGAFGAQELIQRLAGLPVTEQPEKPVKGPKAGEKKPEKASDKSKSAAKKAPTKETESAKAAAQTGSAS